ncbi:2-hydroxychromene-2-carboxylate isomerase [Stagnimonas aquatica]|uniref:2-hydroxychromene-2-carboxylate isomerase n=1 Tax=Stagnimonas aquatica TaxID=2689987 RepID=A0A3N0VKK2_9GAMM|nr:2-hydroxychromene-2-carboxylate isomerase [Stagnimonas aquatica]ROH93255.1 2-hydroxychromene-2-carboxylate isomerase [Stagnimonas aquatica]
MSKTIEFFWDPASTYSYLAATQIEALARRCGAEVHWKPFLLGKVFEATGNKMPAALPAKGKYLFRDARMWAKFYGVPFRFPKLFPLNSVLASRACLAAADQGKGVEFSLALLKAYWAEGQDPSQPEVVSAIAESVGLDGAALLAATQEPAVKEALRANTEAAIQRGAFGAPTFYVDDQMFWGNDRLNLLEAYLKGQIGIDEQP